MKEKLKLKNKAITLALALAMVISLLPAMTLPAHASSAEETWNANQTIESTKTINGGVYVDLEVSVTISKGATLTINNGIYMRDGAELTVYGEGTLIVNGYNGKNGKEALPMNNEFVGGNGENGGSAIDGNIIVAGGEVLVTGGRGGNGGSGENKGGNGGNGGYGVKGNVTVSGGSITVTGGNGGSGATASPVGEAGSNGSNTRAVSGDISRGEGVVVIGEESEDGSIWNYISGGSSDRQYVRAKVPEPVKVKLDAGTDHGALFTDEVLADMVSQTDGFASATREGDIITIGVTNTSMTEYELLRTLDEYILTKLFAQSAPKHNDEAFMTIAPKSLNNYSKGSELSADIKARKEKPTVIEEGFTAYMLWATKYSEEITLTAKTPVAGGDPKDYLPETPEGIVLYEITLPPGVPEGTPEPPKFNFWTTNTTEPFTADPMEDTFAAGDEYACVATPDVDPESSLWARYLADDISIKVDNAVDEVVGKRYGIPSVSYKVTVAKVDVTGITLNKEELTLEKEADETLEATVAPTDASKKTVTWKSSDKDVATVDENGKVTAVAVGTATITATATNGTDATDDDKTATCTVTVTGKSFNITKSEMENGSVTVKLGDAEATKAKEGETVTLVVEPAEGYQLKELQAVYLGMSILDLTEVTEGEKYTFTMPDNDVTVSAKFEKKPVTVNVNVGEGHADLFKPAILEQIKGEFSLQEVTLDGNILTLKGVDPSDTEDNLRGEIANFVYNLAFMDNGEEFINVAYKAIDEFATYKDYQGDTHDGKHGTTPVSEGLTYYLLWAKPYEKLEIDNGNPTCGNEMWKAFPTVPDGLMVDPEDSVWRDENGERVGTFEGGKTYTFSGRIYKRPYGALWKYFINPDNFTLTVKGGKDVNYNLYYDWIDNLTFTATADHDWDEGEITKKATCTEKGEKTFKCKAEGCEATKIEVIEPLGHKMTKTEKVDPTCAKAGTEEYWTCETCKKMFSDKDGKNEITKPIEIKATGKHTWDAGKVTKEATESAEGVKTYTCTVCKATKTESIPKLDPKPEPTPEPKPTPEKKSTAKPVIVAKGIASGKTAVNISWNKVKGADRYVIYLSRCNYKGKTYTLKKVKTVNAKTLKWKKKKLNKNTSYKFYVVAQKKSGKTYKTVAKSYVGHFFTGNERGKLTNPKSLSLKKSALTLKKGKSATIKASVAKVKKGKKLATGHAVTYRYISNNPSVATVNAKGKVTAKAKGSATIYVQTINGIWKTCKVTVK